VTYILVLLVGVVNQTGVGLTSVPGFDDRAQCESAGEAWRVLAKAEYSPRYYCIPGTEKRAMTLR
jgi:hypothetical protein